MNLVVVEMVGVVVVMIMIVTGVAQCANDGGERACAVVAERIISSSHRSTSSRSISPTRESAPWDWRERSHRVEKYMLRCELERTQAKMDRTVVSGLLGGGRYL